MSDFDRATVEVDEPVKRSGSSRFGDLGDRLARTFGGFERSPKAAAPAWDYNGDLAAPLYAEPGEPWDGDEQRFPVVRHGYDCATVDDYVAQLEGELEDLRHRPAANAVAAEIERIGEQTSSILLEAHEQAQQITRRAQTEAERCLNDAAARAVEIGREANEQLRRLDGDTDAIWQERSRLVQDVRKMATELFSLAEEAAERFPAEPEKSSGPAAAVASEPVANEPIANEPIAGQPAEPGANEPVAGQPAEPGQAQPAGGDAGLGDTVECPAPEL